MILRILRDISSDFQMKNGKNLINRPFANLNDIEKGRITSQEVDDQPKNTYMVVSLWARVLQLLITGNLG